ncbi:MAG: dihydrolipoamide acetyltransferase family protein [Pseudanabaenaceae cyanobacterium bins.68]|nr:dihydrolipoamide acetyltransferase family protein [Pseudanabaenaceae cyanobacterium bins.68]
MPALSSTMTEGKIVSWEKAPGDRVEKGETVVIVESDKADMDVESFYEGFLGVILVPAGQAAPVGSAIAYIAETEAEIAEAKQRAQATPASSNGSTSAPKAPVLVTAGSNLTSSNLTKSDRLIASPRAKRLAKDHNLDLSKISGTGPNGRITAEDVESSVQPTAPAQVAPQVITPVAQVIAAPKAAPAQIPSASEQVQPLTTLQNAVIRNMNASLAVPTFQVSYRITTTALDALYKQLKPKGVTMSTLLAKAVALTLQKHPLLNASFSDRGIVHKPGINVAIAVAMDDGGLITPVLPQADQTDIYSLSRQWKDLVERARAKQLQPEEYNSGTFTISNLGMFGVEQFTAILPPGTGAILAVGGSHPQVVASSDGSFSIKTQMQVNITCDHRVIYGAQAAKFLHDLAHLIESKPESLTL